MDYSNIPTGLKITSQIPLDVKKYVKDEDTLAYLGVDDNLAFTYHDQLEVLCLEEKSKYIWREVQPGEENTGLVPLDFIYPLNLPETYNINYSGKTYNFFLTEYITVENINENINIINVGEGVEVYKGYNGTSNEHEFRTVVTENLGAGKSFLRDIQQNTDELNIRVKTITSTKSSINIEGGLNELNFEVNNLQKTISIFPYEFTSDDDKYTIFVDNASSNVLLNIPDDLVDNFCCTLIQKGTGEVAVVTTGTSSLSYPSTLQNIIKGQNFWALIEKESNLDNYFLIGSLKTI